MDEYALIMRHEDGTKIASPEQMKLWMDQTMEWLGTISAEGKLVSGTGLLFDDARVVKPHRIVEQRPFGGFQETIGGYIIVRAESIDEAVRFAHGCPVLQGEGNSVEVRKIARGDGTH
jgi:hypothetical protein